MSIGGAILIILGIAFLVLIVLNILKAINTAKATAYSFVNSIQCGTNWCAPAIDDTLALPGPINTARAAGTHADPVAQRYCADLIGRITLKTTPYIVENPPESTLIFAWTDDTNYPSFCLTWQSQKNPALIFVAIRGTMSFAEVIVDLDYEQKSLPRNPPDPSGQVPVLVHTGFTDLYEKIHPGLLEALGEAVNGGNKAELSIYVTGHSLGSGIATLCAIALRQSGYNAVAAYVFASPRVGNLGFVNQVAAMGLPLFRLENVSDLVPTLPLAVCPNFNVIKAPYFYEHAGTVETFTDNRKSLQNNHLIAAYIDFLIKKPH